MAFAVATAIVDIVFDDAVMAATPVILAVAKVVAIEIPEVVLASLSFPLLAGKWRGVGQPRSLDALAAMAESCFQDFWGVLRLFN